MSNISHAVFRSWTEYKRDLIPELFGGAPFRSGRYLFRGCGDADWSLMSAFDRRFQALPSDRRASIWQRLVQSFRLACTEHGVPHRIVGDDNALIAFGQHHGLPTKLLDWSLSPYVATFFAFRDALAHHGEIENVAVWALDTHCDVWADVSCVQIVAPPAVKNLRLRNQAGRFTLCRTAHLSLEEHVYESGATGAPLMKMIMPASDASHALPDLDAMGVSAAHLFPDVTGLTESVIMREELASWSDGDVS